MFERFDIYIDGRLMEGADPEEVRRALCRVNGIDDGRARKLLSGVPVRVKSGVDAETAGAYRATFRRIGVLVDIRPASIDKGIDNGKAPAAAPGETAYAPPGVAPTDPAPRLAGTSVAQDEDGPELLPPNTGTLADCAAPAPARPLPDVSRLDLDLSGTDLDPSPAPPPAEIDTDHLSAEPPNAGSLQDCAVEKPARPLPDVSHLRLLDPD